MPTKAPPVIHGIKCSTILWAQHIDTHFPRDQQTWDIYTKIIKHPAIRCISITLIYIYRMQLYCMNYPNLFDKEKRIRMVLGDILELLNNIVNQ